MRTVRQEAQVQALWQDLRYAMRILRKNAGFTGVALLTLALGIGANTVIFSVVNAVLLQPLPYAQPQRLLAISGVFLQSNRSGAAFSYTKFREIREHSKLLDGAAAYYGDSFSLVTEGEPEAVPGAHATANLFQLLGCTPALGRGFLPAEDEPGGTDVAVLSDAFWRSHYAGDSSAIGRSIVLDGRSLTIVGVLPATFHFPFQYPEPEVWLPRVTDTAQLTSAQVQTGASYLSVIGRMRDGVTLPQAQAELNALNEGYKEQFGSFVDAAKFGIAAAPLADSLSGDLRPSLMVLLGAVGFVLLIACANVANLLLARATARERELAVRQALGASQPRLVRQLLSESVLLALGGGVLGVWLAAAVMPLVRAYSPGSVPRLNEASLDARVLLFSLALCLVTGVVFGIFPALQTARRDVREWLQEGSRGSSEAGRRGRMRAAIVVAEISLALVLLTGAGLLFASFAKLLRVNPGFDARNLVTVPISLPAGRYAQPRQQTEFYRRLLAGVKTIPQARSAGVTSYLPLSGALRMVFVCPEGSACQGIGRDPVIAVRQVSPGYFSAVRTPLLRGRVFKESDNASAAPVVIVNQAAARRYWPGQDPIGKHLANSRDKIEREVVGVVGDVKFNTLNAADAEEMYLPLEQVPWPSTTLLLRSDASLAPMASALRAKISEIDASLPVAGIATMESVISGSVAQPRLVLQFAAAFAGFSLLLAAMGIYGVMAYSVNARRQEMGIRVALGANRSDIVQLIVGQGMRLALLGVVLGVAALLALTRLLTGLLFEVRATDPAVMLGAAVALGFTAFLACYLPARRATRVAPIEVLRCE